MGSPSAGCSTPPDQAATRSITSRLGSWGTVTAPRVTANWRCASNRATTITSTVGYRARRMAMAHWPSAPAP